MSPLMQPPLPNPFELVVKHGIGAMLSMSDPLVVAEFARDVRRAPSCRVHLFSAWSCQRTTVFAAASSLLNVELD